MQDNIFILPSREPAEPGRTPVDNLPVQLTSLIGREQEVAAACALLRRPDVHLLTLTGTGGIGKTRLGLQVATDLLNDFPDGVFFVNLASISVPELVVPTIAQALGLKEAPGQPLLDLLSESLREKELLLLLDNFEQVIGAAVEVAALLSRCPQLKVVVTSRTVLHVRGEQEFAVLPLAVPDLKDLPDLVALSQYEAVALFISRTQAVKPEFQVTNANAPAVAQICVHLDGLPLAIELAAARSKVLPPQALLARLGQRFTLLTSGAQDAPRRQQTLRNTIAWSYGLLDAGEQLIFRYLSVFVGGSTLEAIEAVSAALGDEPGQVLNGIASLIDKSLLQQSEQEGEGGAEPRFMMLETIREYGLECLATSGEREVTQQAHAHYYLRLAEQAEPKLRGPQQAAWFDRLEREHDNLRAALNCLLEREEAEVALRLGGALWWFWFVRGHKSEGLTFLERALGGSKEVAVPVRAKALWSAGNLTSLGGDFDRAEDLCKESLALFQEIGDRAGMGQASFYLGIIAFLKSHLAAARTLFEEGLALSREVGDKTYMGWALHKLAEVTFFQGEYTAARPLVEESLDLFRKAKDKGALSATLGLSQMILFSQGDLAKAQVLVEESLALSKEVRNKGDEGRALCGLAQVFLHQGKTDRARSLCEESLALFKEIEDKWGFIEAVALLARIEAREGDHAAARVHYEESLTLSRGESYSLEIASYLEGFAGVVAAQGELVWAAQLWGAAEALRDAMGMPIPSAYQAEYEREVTVARDTLGKQPFTTAWVEGRTMTPEQAIAAQGKTVLPQPIPIEPSSIPLAKTAAIYPDDLTAREVEVLRLVAQGLTDAHIAEQLIISPRTVNTHLTSIYGKIQVSSRSGATRYAIEHQLL
jgi:predicted ATPase/DNA-binding CsgD family transcriptional regulator